MEVWGLACNWGGGGEKETTLLSAKNKGGTDLLTRDARQWELHDSSTGAF